MRRENLKIILIGLAAIVVSGCATAQWPHEIQTIGPYDPGLTSHQEAILKGAAK